MFSKFCKISMAFYTIFSTYNNNCHLRQVKSKCAKANIFISVEINNFTKMVYNIM